MLKVKCYKREGVLFGFVIQISEYIGFVLWLTLLGREIHIRLGAQSNDYA